MGHAPAGLFGYSHLLGGYAGGQAEYWRVPHADVGPIAICFDKFCISVWGITLRARVWRPSARNSPRVRSNRMNFWLRPTNHTSFYFPEVNSIPAAAIAIIEVASHPSILR
jgi:hypothetical protein